MAVLFISIGRMPFLTTTLDNADQLFNLVITLSVHLHHVEGVDHDPVSGSLEAELICSIIISQALVNYHAT